MIGATSNLGAAEAAIGGGAANVVSGEFAVISGGELNTASGLMSVIPGGIDNVAAGQLSFAAGTDATTSAPGTFAWSVAYSHVTVGVANAFAAAAVGGASIYSNAAASTGVTLAPGSGTWASASDRALKADVRAIDGEALLAGLKAMPVSEWSYTAEPGVRHIGPMAQDFFAAFRVGEDDRHIATIDEDGVVLAAVKALHQRDVSLLARDSSLEKLVGYLAACSGSGTSSFLANKSTNVAAGAESSVGGGANNTVCGADSTVAGGTKNSIVSGTDSLIGAGTSNTISSDESFIGAGDTNSIASSEAAAIVAGSGNAISGSTNAFIGSGTGNSIVSAPAATILGGQSNTITAINGKTTESGGAADAAIAGGYGNTIEAKAANGGAYGFIGGGYGNTVTGEMAVVGGGMDNTASGLASTVPGGYGNVAAGTTSFAAGYEAHAMTNGSFVWADYSPGAAPLTATKVNQFLVRASGGVTFYTNSGLSAGVTLRPGSGSWSSASDRNIKTAIEPVDYAALLDKVASLPISEWSYISEFGTRHIGPMAQDFYAAFHVGEDDRHITMVDEDGVALAAVKALHAEELALAARNAALLAKVELLEKRNAALRREVGDLR
jgi:hypothetical protein